MEIDAPQPPVTIHEVNIKINATEAGWVSSILDKVANHEDFENLFGTESIRKLELAFRTVSDR